MNGATTYINHFRPIHEFRAWIFWAFAFAFLPFSGMPYWWAFALFVLAVALLRGRQVWKALRFRMGISTKWLSTLPVPQLLAVQKKMRAQSNSMFLGTGFEWTQKHCQIAHDILRMPTTDIPGLPRWLKKSETGRKIEAAIEGVFAPADSVRDREP
jgi:conjugal transfer pilus assembly protein TraD